MFFFFQLIKRTNTKQLETKVHLMKLKVERAMWGNRLGNPSVENLVYDVLIALGASVYVAGTPATVPLDLEPQRPVRVTALQSGLCSLRFDTTQKGSSLSLSAFTDLPHKSHSHPDVFILSDRRMHVRVLSFTSLSTPDVLARTSRNSRTDLERID